jgi:hypothetical protein
MLLHIEQLLADPTMLHHLTVGWPYVGCTMHMHPCTWYTARHGRCLTESGTLGQLRNVKKTCRQLYAKRRGIQQHDTTLPYDTHRPTQHHNLYMILLRGVACTTSVTLSEVD